jgi:hypothetical protein
MRLQKLLLVLAPLLVPAAAFAQLNPQLIPESGTIGRCSFITGDIHFDCIPLYVGYLIQLIFSFIGTICLVEIIWGGYEYALSGFQGDTTTAKKRISNAIFGLVFSVLAFLIVDTIVSVLLAGPTA